MPSDDPYTAVRTRTPVRSRAVAGAVCIVLALMLSACQGAGPFADRFGPGPAGASNSAETTATEASGTAPSIEESTGSEGTSPDSAAGIARPVCDSLHPTALQTISDGWDLVTASRGVSEHQSMVTSMANELSRIDADTPLACTGSGELDSLLEAVESLEENVDSSGYAPDDAYQFAADAGNALFEAVDHDDYTFETP